MGGRRQGRARGRHLRVGRGVHARGTFHGQHLARGVPLAESGGGRVGGHVARGSVPGERLRSARHDRERLGMDHRLVPSGASSGWVRGMLRGAGGAPRRRGRELRSGDAGHPDPPQGHQGGIPSLRPELLPAIPAGGAVPRAGGHLRLPSGLPLRDPAGRAGAGKSPARVSRRVPAATPVTIISGYLGAGKTTLVNSLLSRCAGRLVAVVVNDFGSIPIDPALMAGTDALSVSHGCACCTRAPDLLLALGRLLSRRPEPEQVLIEASGVSDPRRIAEAIVLHGLRLDGIVVLADAEAVRSHGEDAMVGPWVRHQLDSADLIVLNKIDLVSGPERNSVRHWISEVAPEAHIIETSHGRVPVSLVLAGPDADE